MILFYLLDHSSVSTLSYSDNIDNITLIFKFKGWDGGALKVEPSKKVARRGGKDGILKYLFSTIPFAPLFLQSQTDLNNIFIHLIPYQLTRVNLSSVFKCFSYIC